jgi:hypothetical protein
MGRTRPASLVLALVLLTGCHLFFPFSTRPGDAGPGPSPERDDARCDDPVGSCNPAGTGQMCLVADSGVKFWQLPPCRDKTGNGCGTDPHSMDKPGFCDPGWSDECVAYDRDNNIASCNDHCASAGKTCQETCVTSRGYPGWGAESWYNRDECADPLAQGVGQQRCDAAGHPWADQPPEVRYRCCCR